MKPIEKKIMCLFVCVVFILFNCNFTFAIDEQEMRELASVGKKAYDNLNITPGMPEEDLVEEIERVSDEEIMPYIEDRVQEILDDIDSYDNSSNSYDDIDYDNYSSDY